MPPGFKASCHVLSDIGRFDYVRDRLEMQFGSRETSERWKSPSDGLQLCPLRIKATSACFYKPHPTHPCATSSGNILHGPYKFRSRGEVIKKEVQGRGSNSKSVFGPTAADSQTPGFLQVGSPEWPLTIQSCPSKIYRPIVAR